VHLKGQRLAVKGDGRVLTGDLDEEEELLVLDADVPELHAIDPREIAPAVAGDVVDDIAQVAGQNVRRGPKALRTEDGFPRPGMDEAEPDPWYGRMGTDD
jgi:hypothetical protein